MIQNTISSLAFLNSSLGLDLVLAMMPQAGGSGSLKGVGWEEELILFFVLVCSILPYSINLGKEITVS